VDAAGSFHVPRYTKRKRPGTENEEEQEEDAFEGLDEDESDDGYRKETTPTRGGKEGDKGKGKMKERVGKDKGPQYRQRFKEDESYLGAGQSRSESVPPDIPSQVRRLYILHRPLLMVRMLGTVESYPSLYS
jgi:hypothetical protein